MDSQKILVRRYRESGKILSHQYLFDDDTTEHVIINDLPELVYKEGYFAYHSVKDDGSVEVLYSEIPKTEAEMLSEKILEQEKLIADLMLMVAGGAK